MAKGFLAGMLVSAAIGGAAALAYKLYKDVESGKININIGKDYDDECDCCCGENHEESVAEAVAEDAVSEIFDAAEEAVDEIYEEGAVPEEVETLTEEPTTEE